MTAVAALAADELWRSMFSTRIANCLVAAGVDTQERLAQMPDWELLRLPYFGRVCLREVRAVFPNPNVCPMCGGTGRVQQ